MTEDDPPTWWAGVTQGGATAFLFADAEPPSAGEPVAEIRSPDGAAFTSVDLWHGDLLVTTDAVASGQRYRWSNTTGEFTPLGLGTFVDVVRDEYPVWFDPNANTVTIERPGELVRVSPDPDLGSLVGATVSPDGCLIVVVVQDQANLRTVHALSSQGDLLLSDATRIHRGDTDRWPSSPAVDRTGRVIVELEQVRIDGGPPTTIGGIVIDPATRRTTPFDYQGDVLDQSIDQTGRYLIIAYSDGAVEYRNLASGQSGFLQVDKPFDRVDW
jgi:hypothetical protein